MIILYYADSLGMPRPDLVDMNQRYIYLLQQWLEKQTGEEIFVLDRAKSYSTIDTLFESYNEDHEYISARKDVLIIHDGVVDCAPRPMPRPVRDLISQLPGFIRKKIITIIHNNRSRLLRSGFRYLFTSVKKY